MDGDGAPPAAASQQVACLSEELARKAEDTARQQEEISQLLAQVVELQQKCRTVSISPCSVMGGTGGTAHSPLPIDSPLAAPQYGTEVEELQQHLAAAKEVQQQLRTEVSGGGRGEEGMAAGPHWGCCAQSSNIPPPPPPHTHTQLQDLQDKYVECGGMLQEAQEEVKSLRSRSLPNSTVSRYGAGSSLLPLVGVGGHGGGWGGAASLC